MMKRRTLIAIPALVLVCSSYFGGTLAQSAGDYTLSGDLTDETGQPLSGAIVCAIPDGDGVVRVRDKVCAGTDARGKFVIHLTQAGKYQVVSEKSAAGYMPAYVPFYRNPRIPIPEIVVGDANPAQSVSITSGPKSGIITGKVIDEDADTPIQNFEVQVWQVKDTKARYHETIKGTNSPGRFKLFAPSEGFRLRIVSEGYEDWTMGGGVLNSKTGTRKGPGAMLVPSGSTTDFAVYMKRKNSNPGDATRPRDEKRLPAPAQISPADNAVLDSYPRMMNLEWAAVEGAASYGFEVEACTHPPPARFRLPDDGECISPSPHLERFGLKATTIEFMFRGAQPGRWRVWAIDKDRRPGVKSPWRRFIHLK